MRRPVKGLILLGLSLVILGSGRTPSRASGTEYGQMAPLSRYLIADRETEVALARSAAPSAIASHATVMVLGARGYEVAKRGSNGFTCLVERAWMSPFSSTQFWNPKMLGPICYNPAASRSVLQYTFRRTQLALSAASKPEMLERISAAVAKGELPAPELGSMSYMMSKQGYLGDGVGPWVSHLMFYAPKGDSAKSGASWGADLPGSPVIFDTSHRIVPEPETIFMIPVARWSDGTDSPSP